MPIEINIFTNAIEIAVKVRNFDIEEGLQMIFDLAIHLIRIVSNIALDSGRQSFIFMKTTRLWDLC